MESHESTIAREKALRGSTSRLYMEDSKWFTNKSDLKPLHKLDKTEEDSDNISVGSLDDVMKEILKDINS
jgi:hypothetical protein